jgi:predicted enzyme related to lactoylglutathione lyase
MSNPVTHFEILGRNPEQLQRFYGQAFGWRFESMVPGYAMVFPANGSGIEGGIGLAPDGGPGHATFYVHVHDVQTALEAVERLGGARVTGPVNVPNGPTFALFTDPEGHLVGLATPPND